MVYAIVIANNNGSDSELILPPRIRKCIHQQDRYDRIQPYQSSAFLPLLALSKRLYESYSENIVIYFINKGQVKVSCKLQEINAKLPDLYHPKTFPQTQSSPNNLFLKTLIRLWSTTGTTGTNWTYGKAGENTRYDLYVSLCGIIFPVKPYVDPVIQCRKCWRFNHSEEVCNRPKLICSGCGKPHTAACNLISKCINCQKLHNATDLHCE